MVYRGMDEPLTIGLEVHGESEAPVLRVSGEVDAGTTPLLKMELAALVERGAQHITLDLEDLAFIDSSGLGALVAVSLRLRDERGGRLKVEHVQDGVRKIFENTGLGPMFGIAPR